MPQRGPDQQGQSQDQVDRDDGQHGALDPQPGNHQKSAGKGPQDRSQRVHGVYVPDGAPDPQPLLMVEFDDERKDTPEQKGRKAHEKQRREKPDSHGRPITGQRTLHDHREGVAHRPQEEKRQHAEQEQRQGRGHADPDLQRAQGKNGKPDSIRHF